MKALGMTSPSRDVRLLPMGSDQNVIPVRTSVSAPTSSAKFKGNLNLLPQQSFDLDGLQIKKLQRILDHSHEVHLRKILGREYDSDQKNAMKVKALEAIKQEECIIQRRKEHFQSIFSVNRLASTGDESNLREVLSSGLCSIDAKDPATGRTILIAAVVAEQSHIVRILVKEFHAQVNNVSLLGQSSPLHFSVLSGCRSITLFLLSSGAIVNSQNRQGHTPLHLVTTVGVTKLLLKCGADPMMRCKKGHTPFEYYSEIMNTEEYQKAVGDLLIAAEKAKIKESWRIKGVSKISN